MTNKLDTILAAIANPTRRAILDILEHGPQRVTNLAAPFALTIANVSKHINVLEKAGLVKRRVRGREHVIAFDPKPFREIANWASRYEE